MPGHSRIRMPSSMSSWAISETERCARSAHSSRLSRMELRNRMVVETVGSARRVSEPARIRSVLARGRAGGLRGLIPRILQRNTEAYKQRNLPLGSGTVEEHFTRVPPIERIDYKRRDVREASLGGV